jgi:hypothetical protein
MDALSPVVASKFCELCERAHAVWRIHRVLFDDSPNKTALVNSPAGPAMIHVSEISQEYLLLQIRKLHDPAIQRDRATLGIDYILRFGGWDAPTLARLQTLKIDLDKFSSQLREVRNRILCHNDIEIHLKGETLGDFPSGEDILYFEKLQEFVNIVHERVFGSPSPFSDNPDKEAAALLSALE